MADVAPGRAIQRDGVVKSQQTPSLEPRCILRAPSQRIGATVA